MKIKMLFFVAIVAAIWMIGCSVHQAQTKQDNVLSGQGSMAEKDDENTSISINSGNEQVNVEKNDNNEKSPASSKEFPDGQTSMIFDNSLDKEMLSMATDFAINYPQPFSSAKDLDPTRFTLVKLYENDPNGCDKEGIFWVTPEELSNEVSLRFDISDYSFVSPKRKNIYPRYIEEKKAIAFFPAGELPFYLAEFISFRQEGDDVFYTFDIYDDFITDGHETATFERRLCYRFHLVKGSSKKTQLQAISALEVE